VVQFVLTQFGGSFAETCPLNITQWLGCIAIGFVTLPYGLLLRGVLRFKEPEIHAHAPEEKVKGKEKGKEKGKGKEKERHVEIVPPQEEITQTKTKEDERTRLLPSDRERALANWTAAQSVLTEVGVVNTLRNYKRSKTHYPTRKSTERRRSMAPDTFRRNSYIEYPRIN